jgi:hypothetical protein
MEHVVNSGLSRMSSCAQYDVVFRRSGFKRSCSIETPPMSPHLHSSSDDNSISQYYHKRLKMQSDQFQDSMATRAILHLRDLCPFELAADIDAFPTLNDESDAILRTYSAYIVRRSCVSTREYIIALVYLNRVASALNLSAGTRYPHEMICAAHVSICVLLLCLLYAQIC